MVSRLQTCPTYDASLDDLRQRSNIKTYSLVFADNSLSNQFLSLRVEKNSQYPMMWTENYWLTFLPAKALIITDSILKTNLTISNAFFVVKLSFDDSCFIDSQRKDCTPQRKRISVPALRVHVLNSVLTNTTSICSNNFVFAPNCATLVADRPLSFAILVGITRSIENELIACVPVARAFLCLQTYTWYRVHEKLLFLHFICWSCDLQENLRVKRCVLSQCTPPGYAIFSLAEFSPMLIFLKECIFGFWTNQS